MWIPKSELNKLGTILKACENGKKISDNDILLLKKWAEKGHKICELYVNKYFSK